MIPFVFFFVPETKGIPLEDMDKLFDRNLSAHNAHRVVLSQARMDTNARLYNNKGLLDIKDDKVVVENVEDANDGIFVKNDSKV